MIHIWNVIKFTLMFIFQLFMTVVGIFVIPIAMFWMEDFEPEHPRSIGRRFKWKWFDVIFGNREDGIADVYYISKYSNLINARPTWLHTYNWLAFRNPIHNLALYMGVDDYIETYEWKGRRDTEDTIGKEGFVYSRATGSGGKTYDMYRWCKLWTKTHGIELNIGYKNFNIQRVPMHYRYSFTVSFNIWKKFEK